LPLQTSLDKLKIFQNERLILIGNYPFTVGNEIGYPSKSVVLYTNDGNPYTVLRKQVPRINEQIAQSIVYLFRSKKEAKEGIAGGGTGFLVWVDSTTGTNFGHLYAVTNKHVIKENCSVVRINTDEGKTEIYNLTYYDWELHPNSDVAIAYLGRVDSDNIRFKAIPTKHFITKEIIKAFDIGLGDDVYMVGRFIHHGGTTYNMPSVRSGIISTMPNKDELISLGENEYEAFLVEMRSISGFSGSPTIFDYPIQWFLLEVLTDNKFKNFNRKVNPEADKLSLTNWLLGIDAGNFPIYEKVYEEIEEQGEKILCGTDYKAQNHSGFSVVIPAWKILDLLNIEKFVMERKKQDKKGQIKEGAARPDFGESEADKAPVFTEHDFMEALKQVSRKTSEPVSKKKETSE
jgi:hypothetical protein